MGAPKGLLRLVSGGPTFVEIIAELYRAEGIPIEVVTTPALAGAYRSALPVDEDLGVKQAPEGCDTAFTVLAAWRSCREENYPCTHIWAHPVDLPLVRANTLRTLRVRSRQQPGRIIRPVVGDTPGHPVVLPARILEVLADQVRWQEGPLRDFLAGASAAGLIPEPEIVVCRDQGLIKDFDRPADLRSGRVDGEERGSP
jgi:CTP:molybdopterin cytidylyltransferase MocA